MTQQRDAEVSLSENGISEGGPPRPMIASIHRTNHAHVCAADLTGACTACVRSRSQPSLEEVLVHA